MRKGAILALRFAAMLLVVQAGSHPIAPAVAAESSAIERDLSLTVQGVGKHVTLSQAIRCSPFPPSASP